MKLFVIAALVAVAAAGRLEHLERSYLPPDQGFSFGSNGGFGSHSAHGSVGANSNGFGAAGSSLPRYSAGSSFAGATSNQYLPPDHGTSGSNGAPQFAGSLQGFGVQNYHSQQHSGHQAAPAQQYKAINSQYGTPQVSSQYGTPQVSSQYGTPQASSQFGTPLASNSFGAPSYQAQFPQQSAATSRQYLAPKTSSFQELPQQPFDEQTGYHY